MSNDQIKSADIQKTNAILEFIGKLLCIIVSKQLNDELDTVRKQVEYLAQHDLNSNQIASVLSISPGYASKELSVIRKSEKQVKNNKGIDHAKQGI